MYQYDGVDTAAVEPARTPLGTPGYFTDTPAGTVVNAEILNAIMKELMGLVTAVGGVALDKADDAQLEAALRDVRAVFAGVNAVADTGFQSTRERQGALASGSFRFNSATNRQAAVACSGILVTGWESAMVAGSGSSVTGNQALLAAASGIGIISGDNSAGIASVSPGIQTGSDQCATLGTALSIIDGDRNVHIASEECQSVGGSEVLIGSSTVVDEAGGGTNSTALSSAQSFLSTASLAKFLACGLNVELISAFTLAGGWAGAPIVRTNANVNLTIALDFGGFYPTSPGPGSIFADGTIGAGPADYAECFELLEPGKALEPALLVGKKGRKAKLAEPGDRVLGVVSSSPGVVGNSAPNGWHGRWQRDELGRIIRREAKLAQWPAIREREAFDGRLFDAPEPWTVPDAQAYVDDEGAACVRWPAVEGREGYHGLLDEVGDREIPDDVKLEDVLVPVATPEYDPAKPYTARLGRPEEWATVALLGQVPVRIRGEVAEGDFLAPGGDGVGISTSSREAHAHVADGEPAPGRPIEVLEVLVEAAGDELGLALCLVG